MVVPFNKALFFVCFFWYFTLFTPHIYFKILICMIAGNLVEIGLPKIQSRKYLRRSNLWRYSRKCLRKFNFNEIRTPELSAYHLPQHKDFFPSMMFEIFSSVLAYRIWPFVGCGVFSLCNYIPAPRRGRGVYCFTSVRPSVRPRYFSSHFSQSLLMAEIWYLVTSVI